MRTINLFILPTLVSIVVFVSVEIYLLLFVRQSELRDFSILAISFANAWASGELIMRVAPDEAWALIGSRVFGNIGVGLLGPTTIYLALLVSERLKPQTPASLLAAFYYVPIWVIVFRAGTDLAQTGVSEQYWGYLDDLAGPLAIPYYIFVFSTFLLALFILAQRYFTSEGKLKKNCLLFFMSILVPLVIALMTNIILPSYGILIPEFTVPGIIVYVASLMYALRKYELFSVIPVDERQTSKQKKGKTDKDTASIVALSEGKIYFVNEAKPACTLQVFKDQVLAGRQGLGIIRIHPSKFRELTGLQKTPLIWLSSQEVPDEKVISPNAIARLFATISEFLKTAERPVIILEGIETLIFVNNFREVMGFISSVYEKVAIGHGLMIMPISKGTMAQSEWTLLTKHMDDLELELKGKAPEV